MRALVLALACLALVGTASAHAAFDAGAPLAGRSVHVALSGAPIPVALTPLDLAVRGDATDVELRLVGPDGQALPWFTPAGGLAFPEPGDWTIEARSQGDVARFAVHVWPAGPFVHPADEDAARGVVVAGAGTPLAFTLADASGAPLAWPADAFVRVDGAPVDARREGERLVLDAAWAQGEHVVEFASNEAGLAPDARPPTRILAVPPEEASVYGLEGGGGGGFPVWVAATALALALAVALALVTRARLSSRSCSR